MLTNRKENLKKENRIIWVTWSTSSAATFMIFLYLMPTQFQQHPLHHLMPHGD